ncbi:MAG: NDP-sugar synthase [Chthoniobacterales bacterium]
MTLLILAAGMGSRYGGLKQLDPMGPNGEKLLDYSIYDALQADFNRIVFVIRQDFEKEFREQVGKNFEKQVDVDYVFQELSALPGNRTPNPERQKPWGTTHAIWCARNAVKDPFLSINADDFYGRDPYQKIANFFGASEQRTETQHAMVGFRLNKTLSEHGSVSRGICQVDANGQLTHIQEKVSIQRNESGEIACEDSILAEDTPVSMNFWGFAPKVFADLETDLENFFDTQGAELKSECFIPNSVANIIRAKKGSVNVLDTDSSWFGVTYPDDKARVVNAIASLTQEGVYPKSLWE